MEIEINPLNINEEILLDERFWNIDGLRLLCNEARVLKTIRADVLHWHNLGRRAFAALDPVVMKEIAEKIGVNINKVKSKPMDRAASFSFRVTDPVTGKNRIRSALLSYVGLSAFRKEGEVFVTVWR